jgi:hypothetical protein
MRYNDPGFSPEKQGLFTAGRCVAAGCPVRRIFGRRRITMRIVFVRHGEPDYEHDCLTGTGRQQAAAAAEPALFRLEDC